MVYVRQYMMVSYLKNGIWDRFLNPSMKTNAIVSIITGITVFLICYGIAAANGGAGAAAAASIAVVSACTSLLCFVGMILQRQPRVHRKIQFFVRNASVDFGLVDSDGVFHYFNITDGSIDETIQVDESGKYTLQIRNNSNGEVKVSGFVNY